MATGTNHYKLGLFVLLGMVLALTFVVTLGARNWNAETVRFVSYFDESVQGLEVGSPVEFRRVTVGRVAAIGIAPDQRHVQVTSELTVPELQRLNLGGGDESALTANPAVRAQIAQTGLTGVKFILIDYFDADAYPAEALPFAVPPNHIPAAPSTLKGLESSLVKTADEIPAIADDLQVTLARINALLGELTEARLIEQTGQVLGQADLAMRTMNRELGALQAGELSRSARASLARFDALAQSMSEVVVRLERDGGMLDDAERTLVMLGDVARGSHSLGPEIELTLRELRGAARSLRRFSDALERDPDMLLKGRAQR